MRRFLRVGVSLAALAMLASCGHDAMSVVPQMSSDGLTSSHQGKSLSSVTVAPRAIPSLILGTSSALTVTVRSDIGAIIVAPVTWISRDTTIASVSAAGVVTGRKLGTVSILASYGHTYDSSRVTVVFVPVKSVVVTAPSSLLLGASAPGSAQTLDSNGVVLTGRPVTWSSRNPSVVTVSATGVLTAVGAGTAIVDATSGTATGSATITVFGPLKTIAVNLPLSTLHMLSSTQATATFADAAGNVLTGYIAAWTSSNTTVASVTSSGLVTVNNIGTTVITATAGGKSGSATLTAIAASSFQELPATLPAVYLNTVAPAAPATGGVVINVPAGGNLQNALNAAQPGDVIALANGATYVGNFSLPNKNTTSASWITIRPQNTSALPPEGGRMTPLGAAKANLPLIRTQTNGPAFATAAFAHHYRLIGLDVSVNLAVSQQNFGLVLLGDGSSAQNSLSMIPHDLVLDRMYIHGTAVNELRRCVALNAARAAIIDSYLSDCHESQFDSQAIMAWNGPGPFKIVNNYLEASGENILFGGADPAVPNLIPSDIEIRHNHISKPVSWSTGIWMVKNLFESKNAQRMLVEGNLIENNWAGAQTGVAIALKSVNQSNTCPWCSSQDITMRSNLIRNVGGGFSLAAAPDNNYQTNVHGRRFTVTDNVINGINIGIFSGDGDGFQLNDDITDVIIAHNTVLTPTRSSLVFNGPHPTVRMTIRDNLLGGGPYALHGSGTGLGTLTLTTYMPGGTFLDNILVIPSITGYPGANFYPTSISLIGMVVPSYNFRLLASSPYKGRGSDGRDPGANIDLLNNKLEGIIVP